MKARRSQTKRPVAKLTTAKIRRTLPPRTPRAPRMLLSARVMAEIAGEVVVWRERYGFGEAEAEVLRLSAIGFTRTEVARERGVAPSTLKKQLQHLLRRTGDPTLPSAVMRLLLMLVVRLTGRILTRR